MLKILLVKTDTSVSGFNAYAGIFDDDDKLIDAFFNEVMGFSYLFPDEELENMLEAALKNEETFRFEETEKERVLTNKRFYYYDKFGENVRISIGDVDDVELNFLFDLDEYA